MNVFFAWSSCFLRHYYQNVCTIDDLLQSFFSDHIYFFISLQFCLSIKPCNMFVNVPVTQLRIALDWEPVGSAWSSRGVAGAMTPVTREEDTAARALPEVPWSSWERTAVRWFLTPAFVQRKRTTSGPLSSVQVRNVWKQLQFFQQFGFSIKVFFPTISRIFFSFL